MFKPIILKATNLSNLFHGQTLMEGCQSLNSDISGKIFCKSKNSSDGYIFFVFLKTN